MHNPVLVDWVRDVASRTELVLSVCTGALVLAKAGLLDGLDITTHHGAIDLLRQTATHSTVRIPGARCGACARRTTGRRTTSCASATSRRAR